jgi:hypothetical protein
VYPALIKPYDYYIHGYKNASCPMISIIGDFVTALGEKPETTSTLNPESAQGLPAIGGLINL